eukprot:GHVH01015979.1.p1 GENE.GHVH01015979.1~~GHVH01015979.1.p1  ORF type:complete len:929 (-),score=105.02 GHVH01015979.1:44-2830(-)
MDYLLLVVHFLASFAFICGFLPFPKQVDDESVKAIRWVTPDIEAYKTYRSCTSQGGNCEVDHGNRIIDAPVQTAPVPDEIRGGSKIDRLVIFLIDGGRFDSMARVSGAPKDIGYLSKFSAIHSLEADPSVFTLSGPCIASHPTTTTSMLLSMMQGSYRDSGELLSFMTGFDEALADNALLRMRAERNAKITVSGDESWVEDFGEEIFSNESNTDHFFDMFNWDRTNIILKKRMETFADYVPKPDGALTVEILHSLSVDTMSHLTRNLFSPMMTSAFNSTNAAIEKLIGCLGLRENPKCADSIVSRDNGSTALLIVSDHGMTTTGDHGQDTPQETQGLWHLATSHQLVQRLPTINERLVDGHRLERIEGIESHLPLPDGHGSKYYHILHHVDLPAVIGSLTGVSTPMAMAGNHSIGYSYANLVFNILENQWRLIVEANMSSREVPEDVLQSFRNIMLRFYDLVFSDANDAMKLESLAEELSSSEDMKVIDAYHIENRYFREANSNSFQMEIIAPSFIVLCLIPVFWCAQLGEGKLQRPEIVVPLMIFTISEAMTIVDSCCFWWYKCVTVISFLFYYVGAIMTKLFTEDDSEPQMDKSDLKIASPRPSSWWSHFGIFPLCVLVRVAYLCDTVHSEVVDPLDVDVNMYLPEWLTLCLMTITLVVWETCDQPQNTSMRIRSMALHYSVTLITLVQQLYSLFVKWDVMFNIICLSSLVLVALTLKDSVCTVSVMQSMYFMHSLPSHNGSTVVAMLTFTYTWFWLSKCEEEQKSYSMTNRVKTAASTTMMTIILWSSSGGRFSLSAPFYASNAFSYCDSTPALVIGFLSVMYRVWFSMSLGFALMFRFETAPQPKRTFGSFFSEKIMILMVTSVLTHLVAFSRRWHPARNKHWNPRLLSTSLFGVLSVLIIGLGYVLGTSKRPNNYRKISKSKV